MGDARLEDRGVYGDQYGFANALISGFAFTGLLVAILLQRADLKHQMDELQESQALVQRQIFEGTLFQMMSLRERIVSEIKRPPEHETQPARPLVARNAIRLYAKELVDGMKTSVDHDTSDINNICLRHDLISLQYHDKYEKMGSSMLSHYMRLTYNIAKYIDGATAIEASTKVDYFRIFRAQLSDDELLLLLYNCISRFGYEKFMPLADKYDLFDNLSVERLAVSTDREFSRSSFFDDYKDIKSDYYDENKAGFVYRDAVDEAGGVVPLADARGLKLSIIFQQMFASRD
ncbi:MAG: hypothetical protein Phyf2KO_09070 [Phycisphaerales bacterium]